MSKPPRKANEVADRYEALNEAPSERDTYLGRSGLRHTGSSGNERDARIRTPIFIVTAASAFLIGAVLTVAGFSAYPECRTRPVNDARFGETTLSCVYRTTFSRITALFGR